MAHRWWACYIQDASWLKCSFGRPVSRKRAIATMKDHPKGHPESNGEQRFVMSEQKDRIEQRGKKEAPAVEERPIRYAVRTIENDRALTCLETPHLAVHIKAGFTVSASAARKSAQGTIYLDGSAQGEPFLDNEKKVYNFDHHEGCVRTFTLATCEQILVMILKGWDLRDRDWKIFANEPDLDTVLAIWLIFNHLSVSRKDPLHIRFLYALVRLEGAIDALGLEFREFTAFPAELLRRAQLVIDYLRKDEIQLKKDGLWHEIDGLEYTASILHKIDRIVYKSRDFNDFKGVSELARVDISEDRIVAVVEAESGIYEMEPQLQHLYGNRLGMVALRKSENMYTLRRMDLFMPWTLEAAYERLNLIDPAVRCANATNRWGGSADIGGSPRASGTQLSPQEIARACRDALQKPNIRGQLAGLAKTALITAAIVSVGEISRLIWALAFTGEKPQGLLQNPGFGYTAAIFALTAVVFALPKFRRSWRFGIDLPRGKDWWWLLPAVLICGYGGGVWMPLHYQKGMNLLEQSILFILLVPLSLEILFRGLALGLLTENAPIQYCESRWFLSWPTVGSAFLYAGFIGYLKLMTTGSPSAVFTHWSFGNIFGAFGFGIAVGMVRERAQSVIAAVLFHALAALVVLLTAAA